MATLVVRDNGIGLPAQRSGASMGLSLAHALVQQIDAQLQAESVDGACFTLTFPQRSRLRRDAKGPPASSAA